jgi:hypothetical protein
MINFWHIALLFIAYRSDVTVDNSKQRLDVKRTV